MKTCRVPSRRFRPSPRQFGSLLELRAFRSLYLTQDCSCGGNPKFPSGATKMGGDFLTSVSLGKKALVRPLLTSPISMMILLKCSLFIISLNPAQDNEVALSSPGTTYMQ